VAHPHITAEQLAARVEASADALVDSPDLFLQENGTQFAQSLRAVNDDLQLVIACGGRQSHDACLALLPS
jgi:hypothetical protein